MAKLLFVEDDHEFARGVLDWLRREHYQIEQATNGQEAVELLSTYEYDLIILDWELPLLNGIDVLRKYRTAGGRTPILMLTGKDAITDKVSGLDSGADDYLNKPFHPVELSSRIRALIRRASGQVDSVLQVASLTLNPSTAQVKVNGTDLQLKRKEIALLEFLMRHLDQSFTAEALLARVWTSESEASANTVKSHVYTLRKKLDAVGLGDLIQTNPGSGYKIPNPSCGT